MSDESEDDRDSSDNDGGHALPPTTKKVSDLLRERGSFPIDKKAVQRLKGIYAKYIPKPKQRHDDLLLAVGDDKPSFADFFRELLSESRV